MDKTQNQNSTKNSSSRSTRVENMVSEAKRSSLKAAKTKILDKNERIQIIPAKDPCWQNRLQFSIKNLARNVLKLNLKTFLYLVFWALRHE